MDQPNLIAYRCPSCGCGVLSSFQVTSLPNNLIKLKCSCGKSELIVSPTENDKYSITVPCLICPKPHTYTISSSFLKRDLFTLTCPYGDDVITFFSGDANQVKAAIAKNELDLLDTMEKYGVKDFSFLHDEEDELIDEQKLREIKYVLNDLEENNHIHCLCENNHSKKPYRMTTTKTGIQVSCEDCSATTFIPVDNGIASNDFIYIDDLYLTK